MAASRERVFAPGHGCAWTFSPLTRRLNPPALAGGRSACDRRVRAACLRARCERKYGFDYRRMVYRITNNSLAMRSSPHSEFSDAILRISARNSTGIGGRPALYLLLQNSRHPVWCQRRIVCGRTMTIALCQSNIRVSNAKLIRVAGYTRRGVTPRSRYWASCCRRTSFSAWISAEGRDRSRMSLNASETRATTIRTSEIMA